MCRERYKRKELPRERFYSFVLMGMVKRRGQAVFVSVDWRPGSGVQGTSLTDCPELRLGGAVSPVGFFLRIGLNYNRFSLSLTSDLIVCWKYRIKRKIECIMDINRNQVAYSLFLWNNTEQVELPHSHQWYYAYRVWSIDAWQTKR